MKVSFKYKSNNGKTFSNMKGIKNVAPMSPSWGGGGNKIKLLDNEGSQEFDQNKEFSDREAMVVIKQMGYLC